MFLNSYKIFNLVHVLLNYNHQKMGKRWLFLSIVCAALICLSDISESFPVELLKTLKFEELIKTRKYFPCQ